MRDMKAIKEGLLHRECQLARELYSIARSEGYDVTTACGIIYKHGLMDGRDKEKSRADAAHKALHELRRQIADPKPTPGDEQEGVPHE